MPTDSGSVVAAVVAAERRSEFASDPAAAIRAIVQAVIGADGATCVEPDDLSCMHADI
jgi:hypothetical protein